MREFAIDEKHPRKGEERAPGAPNTPARPSTPRREGRRGEADREEVRHDAGRGVVPGGDAPPAARPRTPE
jgi:hypothetical protein